MSFTEKQLRVIKKEKLTKEYQELIEWHNEKQKQILSAIHYMANKYGTIMYDGRYCTIVELRMQRSYDIRRAELAKYRMKEPEYDFEYFVRLHDSFNDSCVFDVEIGCIDWELNNDEPKELRPEQQADSFTNKKLKKAKECMLWKKPVAGYKDYAYNISSIILRYPNCNCPKYYVKLEDDCEKKRDPVIFPLNELWRR